MKNKKIAFTLSEVLICMTIIGIIMALSANTIKIVKASYTALSYFAFKNLENAVGILYAGSAPFDNSLAPSSEGSRASVPYPVSKCIDVTSTGHLIISVLQNDYEFADDYGIPLCNNRKSTGTKHNSFCNALASLSNTAGSVDCDNLHTAMYDSSTQQPYIEIENGSYNFRTTNGQRYYISNWVHNNTISTKYGYRLVAIDLNGERRPNKTDYTADSKNQPDIVTFMVLDNGEVFPLGAAADNSMDKANGKRVQYINSSVKGYYFFVDEDRDLDNVPQECKLTATIKEENENGETITKTVKPFSCNFSVVPIQNTISCTPTSEKPCPSLFTYRQAYCTARGGKSIANKTYCNGISGHALCPPSNDSKRFDLCRVENIKPMFRYNFR